MSESRRFLSENKKIAGQELRFGKACFRMGGKQMKPCIGMSRFKFFKAVVIVNLKLVPVVQTGALQIPVINGKTEGTNKVQPAAGDGTGSGYIAGVLRYFRLNQNNVKHTR